jgi:hypothetical protein
MIRLARRALVVVLLPAAVGTASAEAAWALWKGSVVSERGEAPDWRRVAAFNSEAECRASALREARFLYDGESRRRDSRSRGLEIAGSVVDIPIEFDMMTVSFECYPDTIDPRGPKGKDSDPSHRP